MSTKHPRLNVTLSSEALGFIAMLADKEEKSLSMIARDLIEEALELREDLDFSKLAAEIDRPDTVWISHEDAWK
jgi:predicted DNA-binding protein